MNAAILHPVIALLCGIAILIWPRILNYIVAASLMLVGVTGIIAYAA